MIGGWFGARTAGCNDRTDIVERLEAQQSDVYKSEPF